MRLGDRQGARGVRAVQRPTVIGQIEIDFLGVAQRPASENLQRPVAIFDRHAVELARHGDAAKCSVRRSVELAPNAG